MTNKTIKTAALAFAAASGAMMANTATAAEFPGSLAGSAVSYSTAVAPAEDVSYHGRHDRYDRYDRYDRRDRYRDARYDRGYYGDRVSRNTRVWRGRDGRYYCKKDNGTTGLLIGAAVGGLAGHEIAGRRGDQTLGALLGAVGGALLGREIDRSDTRCR